MELSFLYRLSYEFRGLSVVGSINYLAGLLARQSESEGEGLSTER